MLFFSSYFSFSFLRQDEFLFFFFTLLFYFHLMLMESVKITLRQIYTSMFIYFNGNYTKIFDKYEITPNNKAHKNHCVECICAHRMYYVYSIRFPGSLSVRSFENYFLMLNSKKREDKKKKTKNDWKENHQDVIISTYPRINGKIIDVEKGMKRLLERNRHGKKESNHQVNSLSAGENYLKWYTKIVAVSS